MKQITKKMQLRNIKTNQVELISENKTIFFSYNTPVACHIQGKGYFKTSKRWSVTTSIHINNWLDGITAAQKDQSFFDGLIK